MKQKNFFEFEDNDFRIRKNYQNCSYQTQEWALIFIKQKCMLVIGSIFITGLI